jgi:hypothetical protein
MSSCAIMQPTYLPWAGYFHLIASVDQFVLLDDVQFERSSWQHRNRILLNGSEHLLSIPTKKMPRDQALLYKVEISMGQKLKEQHWTLINQAYRKTSYGPEVLHLLQDCYLSDNSLQLVDFTGRIIQTICTALAINTPILKSSSMNCTGRRADHLAEICLQVKCDTYLSPQGAAAYLAEDAFVEKHGLDLKLQDFKPKPYPQYRSQAFVSNLSMLDVIANIGIEGARQYIGEHP